MSCGAGDQRFLTGPLDQENAFQILQCFRHIIGSDRLIQQLQHCDLYSLWNAMLVGLNVTVSVREYRG